MLSYSLNYPSTKSPGATVRRSTTTQVPRESVWMEETLVVVYPAFSLLNGPSQFNLGLRIGFSYFGTHSENSGCVPDVIIDTTGESRRRWVLNVLQ